ncbi:TAT-variant-translocated molybdopterin oxidoreductase [Nitrobacter sp.]|uniref:TAT-variant-translocated molybdopterin oxidoreductase n=1 Tax=Nitrobacter sp. TaxID=29420 RepID=UPI003F64B5D1
MNRRSSKQEGNSSSPTRLWSGIEELSGDPSFESWVNAEFPSAMELPPAARRQFLKLMGASFALAGLTACEKSPFVAALPYVDQPVDDVPGVPRYYASAVTLEGYAQPVIATTYAGRPTKLDGNPDHPVTQGRSDIFMQAAILGLYDPDRAQAPTRRSEPVTWKDVAAHFHEQRANWSESQGKGVRLLMEPTTSPTLLRQVDALLTQFPLVRVHTFEAVGRTVRRGLTQAAYGRALDVHYALDKCDVIVSLDDDFLGPGPDQVRNARAWSAARRRHANRPGVRLLVAEPVPSATGAVAAERLAADVARMSILAEALAAQMGVGGASMREVSDRERRWIEAAAAALKVSAGRNVVACGGCCSGIAALWVARLNEALKNPGQTLSFTDPIGGPTSAETMSGLIADMRAGQVDTLIVVDANPVYATPVSLGFVDALAKVPSSVHVGLQRDETGYHCEWQLPLTHMLESWSDARAVDGTATIIQPTIAPFYDVRSVHEIFAMLLGEIDPSPDGTVRETWRAVFGDQFNARWSQALHDGFIPGAAPFVTEVAPRQDLPSPMDIKTRADDFDVVFHPDPTIWDGRFANVGWLQELPKPLTTLTWGNVISIGPSLARCLNLSNGDGVEIAIGDRHIQGPVWVMPGQAANTVALSLGYGRTRSGRVGDNLGYNAFEVMPADGARTAKGSLRKTGKRETLAVTQLHHRMEGFDFVREVSPSRPALPKPEQQASLYPPWPSARNAWGMVIDLDSCIGCNACVAACTAENNVPVVGKEQVEAGREMHWLRIARYYTGDVKTPRSFFQPVPCMHCEQAPCEMGCPVHATTHSPEGVNQMVYNRCIGTRTCSSFCPYKVRRFNFYDYRAPEDSPLHAADNPDVTVRARGVMEKCTYCTQRIEAAHAAADKENRAIREGEVVTACQSACPTRAITFGDINDPQSEVSRLRRDGRHYALLEEQGTRPRTTYLARWRDSEEDQG